MVTCSLKEDLVECEVKDSCESKREPYIDNSSDQKHINNGNTMHDQPMYLNGNSEEPVPVVDVVRHLHPVTNLRFDYIERDDSSVISITLYIKSIEKESLSVTLHEESVTVVFRTSDPAMVKKHSFLEGKDNYLSWSIQLKGKIVPAKSTHHLKACNLEIKLLKAQHGTWGALEGGVIDCKKVTTPVKVKPDTWIPLAPPKSAELHPVVKTSHEEEMITETAKETSECVPPVRLGYTGLVNLGNTCYMNSVIQCLANTTPLRNHFQESKFQSEINLDNPLGFKGNLALCFAVLLRQLWSGKKDVIEPSRLKHLLANRASQFSGYAQHDAQEFMAFLLDGLHEDLNRVKCKPSTSPVESDGRPDAEVAEEAWRVYKKRNDSIVVDLFQGQYRSCLVCPVCEKVSVTFDPFLYLSLPLPPSKTCLTVGLFYRDTSIPPVRVTLRVDGTLKVRHWRSEIRRAVGFTSTDVRIVEVQGGLIRRLLADEMPLSSLHSSDELFAFEILPPSPDVAEVAIIQRLMVPLTTQKRCSACKLMSDGKVLKRCTKCYDAAYCDQTCQKNHWNIHKVQCRTKPVVTAHPFIISLPKSEITYRNLYNTMMAYSKFSVEVTRVAHNPEMGDGHESASCQRNASNPPLFFIKPTNHLGQGIAGKERLEDQGETLLDLSPCLALDWRNNERSGVCCTLKTQEPHFKPLDLGPDSLSGDKVTLQHCLQQFVQPEVLGQEEAWYCPKCKVHREATKQMSLWRLPDILIVQLKRFSFRNLLWRDKIDKKVHFPLRNLDLLPYLSPSAIGAGTLAQSSGATYDLFAVVNHYGGILAGHYTAFAQCLGLSDNDPPEIGWRCMDDRFVRDVSADEVVTSAAYCLLYRRRQESVNGDITATNIAHPTTSTSPPSSPILLSYSDPEEVD